MVTDVGPPLGRGRHLPRKAAEGLLESDQTRGAHTGLALLVQLVFESPRFTTPSSAELTALAETAGLTVGGWLQGRRPRPDPATFIGKGKLVELGALVQSSQAGLVIFNHELTPAQERNLERALGVRVIDRTSLILDIFAQRARSHEGQLQVELAQLERLSTRLVRGWSHLERQKGGIGLRGPGETQLETDRRLLGQRVQRLRERLRRVQRQRETQRQGRTQAGVLRVSLVGYTNAGKSTLFNRLTHAQAYTADQLFATLDTTTRRLYLEPLVTVVLSDTVGFIQDLPHTLVDAFRATLEETRSADLLLHVIDGAAAERLEQVLAVELVLKEIGAGEIPQLMVFNKMDLIENFSPRYERDPYGTIRSLWVSARTGAGLSSIRQALVERCQQRDQDATCVGTQATSPDSDGTE